MTLKLDMLEGSFTVCRVSIVSWDFRNGEQGTKSLLTVTTPILLKSPSFISTLRRFSEVMTLDPAYFFRLELMNDGCSSLDGTELRSRGRKRWKNSLVAGTEAPVWMKY